MDPSASKEFPPLSRAGTWARRAIALAALVVLPLVAFHPHLRDWRMLTDLDMILHYGMLLSAYRSVVEFGELPLWNPFLGGGMPNLFFPETFVVAPHFALSYVDPLLGIKAGLLLSTAVGLWGSYTLAGLRLRDPVIRALFAVTYVLSGFHLSKIASGMLWALTGMLIPWALWSFIRMTQSAAFRYRIGFAVVALWMLLGGGVYHLLYTGFLLAIFLTVNVRRLTRPVLRGVLETSLLTLGLCSIKLLPSLAIMAHSRREVDSGEGGFSLLGLWHALVSERITRFDMASIFPGEDFGWLRGFSRDFDENSAYLSFLGLGLLLVGLLRPSREPPADGPALSNRVLYVLLGFSLYASLGQNLGPVSFGNLLESIPLLSTVRVPQRAIILAVLVLPFFVCFGLERVCASIPGRLSKVLPVVVLVLQASLLVRFNYVLYERTNLLLVPDVLPVTDFKHVLAGENPYRPLTAGRATSQLAASFGLGSRVLHPGNRAYRGEYFFIGDRPLPRLASWSTNQIVLEVPPAPIEKEGDRLLVVNQFFEHSWRARDESGAELSVKAIGRLPGAWADQLMVVRIDPSTSRVTLRYEPELATTGLVVFLLTCCAAVLRGWRAASPTPQPSPERS